jgi:3-methyl-2-oxobutanoate hydroxymethyltransferase
MVTAYDAPGAKLAHRAGVDLVLVGDSLAMVVLGHEDTLSVTVEEMAHHTAAVARGLRASVAAGTAGHGAPLIVGDMPWMSYHVSAEDSVRNAAALVRAGAGCVKLEGGAKRAPMVRAIVDAEIPVMGHVGLTPQSVHATGGFKVQGRALDEARAIIADARALEAAGCFALVVEGVPDALAHAVTEAVEIPTIGIGAGPDCDGQVLVWHDLLGIEDRFVPKFVRRYADLATSSVAALSAYAADVRSGAFRGRPGRLRAGLRRPGGGGRCPLGRRRGLPGRALRRILSRRSGLTPSELTPSELTAVRSAGPEPTVRALEPTPPGGG